MGTHRKTGRPASFTRRDALRFGGAAALGFAAGCAGRPQVDEPEAASGSDAGAEDGGLEPVDAGTAGDAGPASDAGAKVDAGTPDVDGGPPPVRAPLFFLQFSDIHIGGDAMAVPALTYALATVRQAFAPSAIFATGDLNETGIDTADWQTYRSIVDAAGLSPDTFLEIPGNHDSYLDGTLANYTAYSLAGRNGRGLYGVRHLNLGGRRLRVVCTNTASAGDPVRDGAGYLKSGQVDALIAAIDAETLPVEATLVLGHHPGNLSGLGALGTDTHLNRLLAHTAADLYLCGHLHEPLRYWRNQTLMAQASTLGNPSSGAVGNDPGFNLVALDGGAVVKHVSLVNGPANPRVAWPVVLITSPASPADGLDLLLGNKNPHVTALTRGGTGQVVRAGVFSAAVIDSVTVAVDGGAAVPMTQALGHYTACVDLPNAASCSLTVRAVSAGVAGTDVINVDLA